MKPVPIAAKKTNNDHIPFGSILRMVKTRGRKIQRSVSTKDNTNKWDKTATGLVSDLMLPLCNKLKNEADVSVLKKKGRLSVEGEISKLNPVRS